jgi:predicted sulfurtransferase
VNSVLNISAYRFVALGDTQALRTRLFQEAGAREAGLDHVWHLEGGILKYFEETGRRLRP